MIESSIKTEKEVLGGYLIIGAGQTGPKIGFHAQRGRSGSTGRKACVGVISNTGTTALQAATCD